MTHSGVIPQDTFTARIDSIVQQTPTIKSFVLKLDSPDFDFLPGQWIDLFIETSTGVHVGGYSMTSSPTQRGCLQLAVQAVAHHPVTRYLHEQARVGEQVRLSAAQGDFYYQASQTGHDRLVLMGAGIGVTPLLSIVRYLVATSTDTPALLIYSARSAQELLFRRELEQLEKTTGSIRCVMTLTQGDPEWTGRQGRIDDVMLDALGLNAQAVYFYCGARAFVEGMSALLHARGVPSAQCHYERWW